MLSLNEICCLSTNGSHFNRLCDIYSAFTKVICNEMQLEALVGLFVRMKSYTRVVHQNIDLVYFYIGEKFIL